ncbi:metal-dependent hydrolase [Hippea maritima]|uniref:Membrane-bound metal-dependent hydrolase n=1 Tax=Hippea maritima (strain ATCC 700847 / DSM 10411 / MH2) TaxID=760142 RepID=F2LV46_HIPMA|nr:metal-dependent hydrolase [Hippea maritima]AEA33630.1 Protein of unknown function DUF457, transmembrane [Hippea maritima DSM 10411]
MKLKSHFFVGLLLAPGVAGIDPGRITSVTDLQVLLIGVFLIGNIIPDIDLALTGFKYERFKERTLLSHRGITHHIFLPIIAALAGFLLNEPPRSIVLAFAFGLALHVALDALSPLGVPYGLKYQKRLSIPLYTTGKWSEGFFLAILTLSIILLTY